MNKIWEKLKIKIPPIIGVIIILILILAILFFLICMVPSITLFVGTSVFTKEHIDGWAGFLGSYLGGILGGIATLIALVITIWRENSAKIKRSATIVYYDFKFALSELWNSVLTSIPDSNQTEIEKLSRLYEKMPPYLCDKILTDIQRNLRQFYFDSDWIKTAAELSSVLEDDVIKDIYRLYGDFLTIQKYINGTESEKNKVLHAVSDVFEAVRFAEICSFPIFDNYQISNINVKKAILDVTIDETAVMKKLSRIN